MARLALVNRSMWIGGRSPGARIAWHSPIYAVHAADAAARALEPALLGLHATLAHPGKAS